MAGVLSKCSLPNTYFLGNLSRFNLSISSKKKYDLLILLSGPEPQRSMLEDLLFSQLNENNMSVLVVRGLPLSNELPEHKNNLHFVNHLPARDLQEAILSAEIIICRSGYSTIMDLIKLNKHAIIVPTPGQTEQEYLASYLMKMKWFVCHQQVNISLKNLIGEYNNFHFNAFLNWDLYQYKKVMKGILEDETEDIY